MCAAYHEESDAFYKFYKPYTLMKMHTQISIKNPSFLIPGHILVTGATLQLKCKLTYVRMYIWMHVGHRLEKCGWTYRTDYKWAWSPTNVPTFYSTCFDTTFIHYLPLHAVTDYWYLFTLIVNSESLSDANLEGVIYYKKS